MWFWFWFLTTGNWVRANVNAEPESFPGSCPLSWDPWTPSVLMEFFHEIHSVTQITHTLTSFSDAAFGRFNPKPLSGSSVENWMRENLECL